MTQLTTKHLNVIPPAPAATMVPFVKPLTYEFRVYETVDDLGKVTNVKLQMQIWEHDEYGSGIVKQYWSDVPRYKFNKEGVMIA